jgi:hypothetical protein
MSLPSTHYGRLQPRRLSRRTSGPARAVLILTDYKQHRIEVNARHDDGAFVASFLDDRPGGDSIVGQAPCGEDHAGASDLLLQHVAPPVQRQTAHVEVVDVEAVESHEHGWRARLVGEAVQPNGTG